MSIRAQCVLAPTTAACLQGLDGAKIHFNTRQVVLVPIWRVLSVKESSALLIWPGKARSRCGVAAASSSSVVPDSENGRRDIFVGEPLVEI